MKIVKIQTEVIFQVLFHENRENPNPGDVSGAISNPGQVSGAISRLTCRRAQHSGHLQWAGNYPACGTSRPPDICTFPDGFWLL